MYIHAYMYIRQICVKKSLAPTEKILLKFKQ